MCSSNGLAVIRRVVGFGYLEGNVLGGPGEGQSQQVTGSRVERIYLMWVEVRVDDDNGIRGVEVDTNTTSPRGQKVDENI